MTERRIGWRDWTLVLVTLAIWLAMLAVCVMDVRQAQSQVTIPGAAKGQVKVPLHAHRDIGDGGKIKALDLDWSNVESGSDLGGCDIPCLDGDNAWTNENDFAGTLKAHGNVIADGNTDPSSIVWLFNVPLYIQEGNENLVSNALAEMFRTNSDNPILYVHHDVTTAGAGTVLKLETAGSGYLIDAESFKMGPDGSITGVFNTTGINHFANGSYFADTVKVSAPALITGVFNTTGINQHSAGTYFTDSVSVTPATDVLPLRVTQHSGATADLTVWEASDGTDMAKVDAAGTGHFGEFTGGTGQPLVLYNGDLTTTAKAKFDLSAITGTRTYTWPDFSGSVVFGGNSATLTGNASSTLAASTASSGAAFQDNTTSSKKLRVITSGSSASTNNAISFTTASSRTFAFTDQVTPTVVLKTGTDGNHVNQTADIGSTTLVTPPAAGLYRVSYYLRTTTADITSIESVTLNVTFTDNVGSTTLSSAPVGLTTTAMTQGSFVVYVASGSIAYTAADGGGGYSAAAYELRIRAEAL